MTRAFLPIVDRGCPSAPFEEEGALTKLPASQPQTDREPKLRRESGKVATAPGRIHDDFGTNAS